MKKYKYFSGLVSAAAVLSLSVLLAACGGGSAEKAGESPEQEAQEASAEQAGDAGGDTAADTGGAVSGKKEAPAGEGMAQKKGDSAGQQEQGKTLAERLAGRYSYEYPPAEDDAERMDEDMTEYYTLDIVNVISRVTPYTAPVATAHGSVCTAATMTSGSFRCWQPGRLRSVRVTGSASSAS